LPNAEGIDVKALVGQITPQVGVMRASAGRNAMGLARSACEMSSADVRRGARFHSWFDEIKKQYHPHGNDERGANDGRSPGVERVREGVFEDVDPPTEKAHHEKAGEAPEGVREAAADGQGSGRARSQRVMEHSAGHGQSSGASRCATAGSGNRKKSRYRKTGGE